MELTEEQAKHVLDSVARHFGYDKLEIVKKNKLFMSSEYVMMMSKKTKNEYYEDQLAVVLCVGNYSEARHAKRSYVQCLLELVEHHAHVVPLSKMIDLNVPSFKFPDTIEELCIWSDINPAS